MWKLRSELETGNRSGSLAVIILRCNFSLLTAFSSPSTTHFRRAAWRRNADSSGMMSGGEGGGKVMRIRGLDPNDPNSRSSVDHSAVVGPFKAANQFV